MDNLKNAKDHLKLKIDHLPDTVLLPGDPKRVYEIASFWEDVNEVGNNRDYVTLVGNYKGIPLAACSSGIGGPSTEIAVMELYKHGVKNIIRVGTSGGLARKLIPGDLVVLSSCIRYSGTSNLFVPENYPAIADYKLLIALINACNESKVNFHVGIGLSVDSFYATKTKLLGDFVPSTIEGMLDKWVNAGALQLDMEAATLFVLASLLGINAGAICTVGSNLKFETKPEIAPSNEAAIKCANEAAIIFKKWEERSSKLNERFVLPPIYKAGDEV